MVIMSKKTLVRAYLNTRYSVYFAGETYIVKVSEPPVKGMSALLEKNDIHYGAILTAWNPRSHKTTAVENKKQNDALSRYLIKNNFIYYDALGEGQDSSWPAEESFFIIGISKEKAESLALEYKQNAYIWLQQNKPVELVFTAIWND